MKLLVKIWNWSILFLIIVFALRHFKHTIDREGSHSLLQGIFPTQGLNPGLPHCRQILYQLSLRGSSKILTFCYIWFKSLSWFLNIYIQLMSPVLILFLSIYYCRTIYMKTKWLGRVSLLQRIISNFTHCPRGTVVSLFFRDEKYVFKLQDLFLWTECASLRQSTHVQLCLTYISYQNKGNREWLFLFHLLTEDIHLALITFFFSNVLLASFFLSLTILGQLFPILQCSRNTTIALFKETSLKSSKPEEINPP